MNIILNYFFNDYKIIFKLNFLENSNHNIKKFQFNMNQIEFSAKFFSFVKRQYPPFGSIFVK